MNSLLNEMKNIYFVISIDEKYILFFFFSYLLLLGNQMTHQHGQKYCDLLANCV